MPRSAINNTLIPLYRKLSQKLGEQQAKNELRWMTEHVREIIGETARSDHKEATHKAARIWRNQPAFSEAEIEQTNKRFSSVQWAWLRQAVSDRVDTNKPLQYILGNQPFGKTKIVTRPPVLIPRWETEEWMLRLASLVNEARDGSHKTPLQILDACTGSGCVALGLASELNADSACITGVDVSSQAIMLATENMKHNSGLLRNKVGFRQLDLLHERAAGELRSETGRWDMIVSNPPYVSKAEYEVLDASVRDWEDIRALVPMLNQEGEIHEDPLGISFIIHLAKLAKSMDLSCLRSDDVSTSIPRLVVEIGGKHQVEPTCQAMNDNGFSLTEVWKDMAGTERVVLGYLKM
ncbi:hypothetical protein IWW36_001061 [Coemansia brasiliensis]|uniref:peptide chain release factor N(5)-glutamine methyltransferase n=1 Tax=Coemansia brasiliensis TaxID=2650707 RepID=A0A9W8M193_9FUNG|nr:hypothetical protein IWW36_001061 [Coemansia brasiliensis]